MRDEVPDNDLEQLLKGAFDAQARARVGEHAAPPPPRFAAAHSSTQADDVAVPSTAGRVREPGRWAAPLAAAAAVVGVVAGVVAIGHSADRPDRQAAGSSSASNPSQPAAPSTVHVKLLNDDGATYGVGMPVIAYFSQRITDGRALQRATVATVGNTPARGAWYFEPSEAGNGPIEAHYRLAGYWPAHARIHIAMPLKGLAAGGGLIFDDNLTTDFQTGAKQVATVSGDRHSLSLDVDGVHVHTYKVSLGAAKYATRPGIKVIMEQRSSVTLSNNAVGPATLPYAQRLTYGGEYLCAAPWNVHDIDNGIDSSGGSTNLLPAAAKQLFTLLRIGDVVAYEHTGGPPMTLPAGYGDWNLPWQQWLTGGLVPTR